MLTRLAHGIRDRSLGLLALALLQALDAVSTRIALEAGAKEVNPVFHYVGDEYFSFIKAGVLVLVFLFCTFSKSIFADVTLVYSGLVSAAVVSWNSLSMVRYTELWEGPFLFALSVFGLVLIICQVFLTAWMRRKMRRTELEKRLYRVNGSKGRGENS